MVYYFTEFTWVWSDIYYSTRRINARSLRGAKIIAAHSQLFDDSVLEVGLSVDGSNIIEQPEAVKINGRWAQFKSRSYLQRTPPGVG